MFVRPDPVDLAVGVLMERHHQDAGRASAMLVAMSENDGREVGEFASMLLELTEGTTNAADKPATVRRAVAFIDANAGRAITVADIAEAARIGTRGLQAAFRRHLDETPLGYLRQVRLEGAHRELIAADPSRADTVARVAGRWQFPHPGRFAVDYRARFGCTPSATLRGRGVG